MPVVNINVLKGLDKSEKKILHDTIHDSLVFALKIEERVYFHRLYEFSRDDFIFPDSKSKKFTMLEIHLFPGRTKEQKALMYKTLCDRLETIGIPRMDIFIQIIESPLENWGIKGGLPGTELFEK